MKIAILSYSFLPNIGGGEVVFAELASRLSEEGNTVFFISNFGGPLGTENNYSVYSTPRLPSEILSRVTHLLVAPFMLFLIHMVNKLDVVQVAGLMDLFATFPVKVIFRIPVVLRLSMWKHPHLIKQLRRQVCLLADMIVALNSYMKSRLISGGFEEGEIMVIPNGVDVNKFKPDSINRREVVILWVGRLDYDKAPHIAIETLSLVKKKHQNVSLQIVGEGRIEQQLRSLVSDCGLQDSVTFLGYQNHDRVAEIMKNGDILLVTSKGEGMSNALLEAMACGVSVIVTTASAIDVVQNSVNGFIVDKNDPKEMALIVSQLVDDQTLRYKTGENARITVLEKFSSDLMFSEYLQLFKKLT